MLTVSIIEGPLHDGEKVPRLSAPARAGPLMRGVAQRIAPKKVPRSAEGKQEFYMTFDERMDQRSLRPYLHVLCSL